LSFNVPPYFQSKKKYNRCLWEKLDYIVQSLSESRKLSGLRSRFFIKTSILPVPIHVPFWGARGERPRFWKITFWYFHWKKIKKKRKQQNCIHPCILKSTFFVFILLPPKFSWICSPGVVITLYLSWIVVFNFIS
jgi:hypothetical protein